MSVRKTSGTGRQPSSAETSEAALLAESLRDVVSRFVKVAREHSHTHSNAQDDTLSLLERTGPVSVATLAARRSVTHQTMRLVVKKLVEQGLATLAPDAGDRRAQVVDLTDGGRERNARGRAARARWLADQLAKKTSPEERAVLRMAVRTLDKLTG